MSCRVFSVGHSVKAMEELADLLARAGIALVCDIRRFPRSRRNPHFGRESLEQRLPARGIGYEWLGAELGGFREDGYEAWMQAPEFARGLERLEELAAKHTVAFMCSEGLPWKCHRLLVARALAERGHRVSHLLPDASVVEEATPLLPPDR
jgi:uncharacterized protein (DUF488 family)